MIPLKHTKRSTFNQMNAENAGKPQLHGKIFTKRLKCNLRLVNLWHSWSLCFGLPLMAPCWPSFLIDLVQWRPIKLPVRLSSLLLKAVDVAVNTGGDACVVEGRFKGWSGKEEYRPFFADWYHSCAELFWWTTICLLILVDLTFTMSDMLQTEAENHYDVVIGRCVNHLSPSTFIL